MKKVYISVINDLVTDQRVSRVVELLIDRGAEVTLIGRRLRESPAMGEVQFRYRRFRMLFNSGALFYATFNVRLFLFLIFRPRPDLLISNDLDTLPANFIVSRIKKVNLIYDSHEYFTEVPELINRKMVKNIWTRIEGSIVPKLQYAITVSLSIAKSYREKYGTDFRVIRNLPERRNPQFDRSVREQYGGRGIIIYQGALNIGRGLELMVSAMKYLDNAVLLLAGDGDIKAKLEQMVNEPELKNRVFMIGRLLPKDLFPITCSSDLGISLEEELGLNYRYALPNKLFDYIQAGIPVLCSDLPEMKAVVETFNVGLSTSERDPEAVAGILKGMLSESKEGKWRVSLERAAEELCWENESELFREILEELKFAD